MKLRSLLLAATLVLSQSFVHAQDPVLSAADRATLTQAITAKDVVAVAQLAKNNPTQAAAIARAAALGAPGSAAVFAAAVAKAAGNEAAVAKAVAAALPAQAATIAAAVAKAVPGQAGAVTTAVVQAAPTQAGSVAVAVLTSLGQTTSIGQVRAITRAAVAGVPAADRTDNNLATIAQTVANTGASLAGARMGASDASGRSPADIARATIDTAAATAAAQAGATAGTAGATAGTTGSAAGTGLVTGTPAVVANSNPLTTSAK